MTSKVRIGDEVFEFDGSYRPLEEAFAIEKVTGWNFGEWESQLQAGSAKALAALVWLVWRRNGREVEFADIVSGKIELDLSTIDREDGPDPTIPGPEASLPTPGVTSRRSASSASARGKSAASR